MMHLFNKKNTKVEFWTLYALYCHNLYYVGEVQGLSDTNDEKVIL